MEPKPETKGIKLEYKILKDNFSRAGEASSNIKKVLRQLGIESSIIRRVAIATYEAEINIVIHSYGGMIYVYIRPDRIEIVAEDEGPGIEDIKLAMQEGYSTASNKVRELGFGAGMGLPNMKRSSDDFEINSVKEIGTKVKMTMYL